MKLVIKSLALAIAAAGLAAPALADTATTKGGFQIKSDDGNFEAKLGGRIHFDGNFFTDEKDIAVAPADNSNSNFFFRRARITLEGRAYDFTYKFENDFASSDTAGGVTATRNEGLREMWIGRQVMGNKNLRLGQAKPYRGMEELTSSNEITFMERPFATATGVYGNQFATGVFLDGSGEGYGYGVSAYTPRSADQAKTQGMSYNARGYLVPLRTNGNLIHIGVSATSDNFETNTATVRPRVVGRENGLRNTGTAGNQIVTGGAFNEQTTVAAELAARFGGVMVQGEYAMATFKDTLGAVTPEQEVDTYYVQASYFLTDHTKPYDFKKGVFKSPKLNGEEGAIELKVRYDQIENKDLDNREASYYAVGVNYYATPNTRFMIEYVDGKLKNNTATELEAAAVTARAQFNF
ncbi:MAG: porin [Pseudomonadota bacterium]